MDQHGKKILIGLITFGILSGVVWLSYKYISKGTSECPKREEVSPIEDLMREHGVLNRLLLIYEEVIRRIERLQPIPLDELKDALILMRSFIENYHEKLEENYIFPIFEAKNEEIDLIKTLKEQHQIGKGITTSLLEIVFKEKGTQSTADELQKLSRAEDIQKLLKAFIALYRPHEARENTELFPKLNLLLCEQEFNELGRTFEILERSFFGPEGFSKVVNKVSLIEQKLNTHRLDRFFYEKDFVIGE